MKIAVQQSIGPLQGRAARRAQLTTDTNGLIGSDAQAVRFVTAAELTAGLFSVEGNGNDLEVVEVTDRGALGGPVLPVYLVNFSVSDPAILPLPLVPSATLILNLQANDPAIVALADGASVSTWPDQSGFGRNFTQTGTARPTKQTVGGYPSIIPDGLDDFMVGPNFADNLDSFAVFAVSKRITGAPGTSFLAGKLTTFSGPGWGIDYGDIYCLTNGSNYIGQFTNQAFFDVYTVNTYIHNPRGTLSVFQNGVNDSSPDNSGVFGSYATSEPVRLWKEGTNFGGYPLRAVMIYSPAPNASDRAAIDNWLAGQYGITF